MEVWEPWVPEIGQWVRVRVRSECSLTWPPQIKDGQMGRVTDIVKPVACGHYYSVAIRERGHWIGEWQFAAVELEPMEAP